MQVKTPNPKPPNPKHSEGQSDDHLHLAAPVLKSYNSESGLEGLWGFRSGELMFKGLGGLGFKGFRNGGVGFRVGL